MGKKLICAGFGLSVALAVIALVSKGGVGMSWADVTTDFSLTGAWAKITDETANACLGSTLISCTSEPSCAPGEFCVIAANSTRLNGNSLDSDSYRITATIALDDPHEFQQDLNQSINFALIPGNCDTITSDISSLPAGTWVGTLPGASLHQRSDRYMTTYHFDGNIPATTEYGNALNFTIGDRFGSETFDHVEFDLTIPGSKHGSTYTSEPATMSLKGNANLCSISGPMAFAVFLPEDNDSDVDVSCVNVPTPQYDTLDISSAYCSDNP